jgi:hypothetical protein
MLFFASQRPYERPISGDSGVLNHVLNRSGQKPICRTIDAMLEQMFSRLLMGCVAISIEINRTVGIVLHRFILSASDKIRKIGN